MLQTTHHDHDDTALQDTIDTQARTIRYLLANYQALLNKVNADGAQFSVGTPQNFATSMKIPAGWWVVAQTAAASIIFPIPGSTATPPATNTVSVQGGLPFFSYGSAQPATAPIMAAPIK